MNKKVILVIAALISIVGTQLMADGCKACAMKHGASKEERMAHKEEKRENRKKRKEAREAKKKSKKRHRHSNSTTE